MTTVTLLRTDYVNLRLGRADADTIPWAAADVDKHIVDALRKTWPVFGTFSSDTVAASQASDIYTVPASLQAGRVSRIVLEYVAGGVTEAIDKVVNWRYHSATQVRVSPRIATVSGLSLRFYSWIPFAATASDLPIRLEPAVADRAAGFAYGQLAAQLVNYKRQQGLDDSRVVDYPTAVGLAAYYERRYFEQIDNDPSLVSYAPRRARR